MSVLPPPHSQQHPLPPPPDWHPSHGPDLAINSLASSVWSTGLRVVRSVWAVLLGAWVPAAVLVWLALRFVSDHPALAPLRTAFDDATSGRFSNDPDPEVSFCGAKGCFGEIYREMQANGLRDLIFGALAWSALLLVVYVATLGFTTALIARTAARPARSPRDIAGSIRRTPALLFAGFVVYLLPPVLAVLFAVAAVSVFPPALLFLLLGFPVWVWWLGRTSLVPVAVALGDGFAAGFSSGYRSTRSRWWSVVSRLLLAGIAASLLTMPLSALDGVFGAVSPALAALGFILVRMIVSLCSALVSVTAQVEMYRRITDHAARTQEPSPVNTRA